MEKLAHSKNTPGTDAAFDLLDRVAIDPATDQRYPNETVLVPADSRDASRLVARAASERRPIAIVFPDGSDVVWRPPTGLNPTSLATTGLLWLADHIRRKDERSTFVPRYWVADFHAATEQRQQRRHGDDVPDASVALEPRRESKPLPVVSPAASRLLDRSSDVPLYFQLAAALKAMLERDAREGGVHFPSEREIEEEFKVSSAVIRPALELLVADGAIVRVKGSRAFVGANAKQTHRPEGG
jgi:hypothetical protein